MEFSEQRSVPILRWGCVECFDELRSRPIDWGDIASMASSRALRPPLGLILQIPTRRPAWPAAIRAADAPWQHPRDSFSTSSQLCKRKTRDSNRQRGVSSLYRSGPRELLSVSNEALPSPVDYKPKIEVDPNHGLWGFFPSKDKLINTPAEDAAHGRAWTVEELRKKDWNDLHSLWWVCCRERNLISTANAERVRAKLGFGDYEASERDSTVGSDVLGSLSC